MARHDTYHMVRFSNALHAYNGENNRKNPVYVQAIKRVAHGDWKTQSVRKEFMGLEQDQLGVLSSVWSNMEGEWCTVMRDDGLTADVRAADLRVLSQAEFETIRRKQTEQQRLNEIKEFLRSSKPVVFLYVLIDYRNGDKLGEMQSHTPIVIGHDVYVLGQDGKTQIHHVKAVQHMYQRDENNELIHKFDALIVER